MKIPAWLETWQGIVSAITVIGGAMIGGYRVVKVKCIEPLKRRREMIKHMEALLPSMEIICKELRPNGGNSFYDRMEQISQKIDAMATDLQVARAMASIALRMANRAYWISDTAGNCTEASPALSELMDRLPEQILGNGWVSALPANMRESVHKEWVAAVAEQREFQMDYAYRRQDGTIIPVTGCAIPIRVGGKIVGYVGWAIPIVAKALAAGEAT